MNKYLSFILVFLFLPFTISNEIIATDNSAEQPEILWDEWGVPHIYSNNNEKLGYGFGWAQMKSHGNDILKLYALARGDGAKYWGKEYLSSDRLLHKIGIPQNAGDVLEQQPSEFRKYLRAFAKGVNDYAREHPQLIDDDVEEILPVETEDLIRHSQRMMFTFVSSSGNRSPILNLNGLPADTPMGSNTMAIGPSKSQSGNAMLYPNPHLPWDIPFMRFYEAHLNGPNNNLYGSTLIGSPVIIIGFNQNLGWSHTINTVDVIDTYELQVEDNGYRFDGDILEFETSQQILDIRKEDGSTSKDTVEIRRSRHGPVIQSSDSSAIAIRSPMFDRHNMLYQFWEMGQSQNFEQFQSALKQLQIPMLTTTYADRDGNIYYLFNGQVPDRSSGNFNDWQKPVSGDTSATLWSEIHDFDELPQIHNPESGFVQNSNSPPWFATIPSPLNPDDYPKYMAPEWLLPREQRGLEMLLANDSISFEDLIDIRYSNKMFLADKVLDDLISASNKSDDSLTVAASNVLENWDRKAEPDSEGALLFTLWALEQCRGPISNFCDFEQRWNPDKPLDTPAGLNEPDSAAVLLGKVATKIDNQYGKLDVQWGEAMRLSNNIPGTGAPGDPLGVYHVVQYNYADNGIYRPAFGDTWSAVIEFTDDGPRAEGIMSYGNSSHPDTLKNNGQLKLISNKEMRPIWFTREQVEKNQKERTDLNFANR